LIAILHTVYITSLQKQQSQQTSSSTTSFLQITQESLSSQSSSSSFSFIIDDNLIKSVLKASSSLIMNANLKPSWISSPFSYHYKTHNINMQTRPFYNISFLLLIKFILKNNINYKYRLQYFVICLNIITSLMYNCNDGLFIINNKNNHRNGSGDNSNNSNNGGNAQYVLELKEVLIIHYLPWIIAAMEYLITYKKVLRSYHNKLIRKTTFKKNIMMLNNNSNNSNSNNENPHNIGGKNSKSNTYNNPNSNCTSNNNYNTHNNSFLSRTFSLSGSSSKSTTSSSSGSSSLIKNALRKMRSTGGSNNNSNSSVMMKNKLNLDHTATSSGSSSSNYNYDKNNNNSILSDDEKTPFLIIEEYLVERILDCLYAYLCMDDMYPCSTYLKYISLFNKTPIIPCISYFMSECKNNLFIQKKGIEILRHFADNQIGK